VIPIQLQLPTWAAVAPTLLLGLTALVLLLIDSIDPDSTRPTALAATAAGGALLTLGVAGWFLLAGTGQTGGPIELYGGSVVVDGMSLFFTVIFASVAAMVSLASYDYLRDRTYQAEFYTLVMLAATGMSLMASAGSLVTVFVSLELASLPSYALVAFLKNNRGSVEAGLKYFLVGAVSSAVFVFGISLIYAVTGSLLLSDVAAAIGSADDLVGIAGVGVVMIAGGFAFKTAAVP
jgi:NADH-quinone oxidoreductase subunit N